MMVFIIIFTCLSFQGWFTCEKVVKFSHARNSQAILFSLGPHFEKVGLSFCHAGDNDDDYDGRVAFKSFFFHK